MPSRQKAKGSSFERDFAEHLSNVFGLSFRRIPTSGAITGGKNEHVLKTISKEQSMSLEGDIMVPIELSHLKFECKFYKDFSFASLYEENKQLDKWIEQSKIGSKNKEEIVVFKINRLGEYLVLSKNFANKMKLPNHYMSYKDSVVFKMGTFFEDNKEILLSLAVNKN